MSTELVVKDRGLLDLLKRAKEIRDSYVKVGVLAGDEKGDERPPGSPLTVAEIAVVNEYGTEDGHIPARPFVRSTFDAKHDEMAELGKKLIESVLDGKVTTKKALDIMGLKLATEVKKTITEGAGVPPPNAPATIRAKGSDRPLVDEGRLLNAITYASVIGEEGEHEGD